MPQLVMIYHANFIVVEVRLLSCCISKAQQSGRGQRGAEHTIISVIAASATAVILVVHFRR